MKFWWGVLVLVIAFGVTAPAYSNDYVVELFEEHYREKMIVGGGKPKIYHSMQVKTEFGDKVLVLVGDDYGYRRWLRKSMHNHALFVVKIPTEGDQKFIYDQVILVNVQQVHAVWEKYWKCRKCRHGAPPLPVEKKTPPVVTPGKNVGL